MLWIWERERASEMNDYTRNMWIIKRDSIKGSWISFARVSDYRNYVKDNVNEKDYKGNDTN